MYLPGTKVRIRTIEELESDRQRIAGKSYIIYWQNTICEVVAGRRVLGRDKYMLKVNNEILVESGYNDYGLQDVWWYDYELEEYDQINASCVDEHAFSTLIEL